MVRHQDSYRHLAPAAFAALLLASVPASNQVVSGGPVASSRSGMVFVTQGSVYVDEEPLSTPPNGPYPYVKESSLLHTRNGVAGVLMIPGVSVLLSVDSSLRMVSSSFADASVELISGSMVAAASEITKRHKFTVVMVEGAVAIARPGAYHFYAHPARVKVFSGRARVERAGRTIEVPAGKMLGLSGESEIPKRFDKKDMDALDRWAAQRVKAASTVFVGWDCSTTIATPNYRGALPCSPIRAPASANGPDGAHQ